QLDLAQRSPERQEMLREAPGDGDDHVRFGGDTRQRDYVRADESDTTTDALASQMQIDRLLVTDRRAHHGMLELQELLDTELRGGDRVAGAHQAHVAIGEQRLLEEIPLAQVRHIADRKIDLP